MWSRYQLKQAAKDIMSRHYWELFAAALVYGLISSGASSLAGAVSQVASLPAALLNLINIEQSQDVLMSFGRDGRHDCHRDAGRSSGERLYHRAARNGSQPLFS